jgi:hypothetical protein
MTEQIVADRGLRMSWVVRLVETRPDGPERSLDVLDLGQLADLGDIADLGLTLADQAASEPTTASGDRRPIPGSCGSPTDLLVMRRALFA